MSVFGAVALVVGLSLAVGTPSAAASPPSNDTFPGAPITDASGSVSGTTVEATAETGEPANHPTWTSPRTTDLLDNSVWYSWTAPDGVGLTYFDLEAQDLGYQALGVYTGGSLASPLTEIIHNEFSPRQEDWDFARVVFTPTAGTTYRIGVGTYYEGAVTLRWGTPDTPGNDSFAAAAALADDTGDTLDATFETGEPANNGLSDLSGRSVWYTYTPSSATSVLISLAGSDFDTMLGVYTGSLGSLTEVNFNDDSQPGVHYSRLQFDALAGVTYHIGIGGWGNYYVDNGQAMQWGDSGSYVLDVTVDPSAPSVTTHPSSQTVTSGSPASFSATATGNPTPTVQWQRSTDGGSTWPNITGATDTTYTIAAVVPSMNGYWYRAVFTNDLDSDTTNGALLTVESAPSVTTHPSTQTVTSGSPASFSATATGNPTPTVQWQRSTDGGSTWPNITGATDTTYTIAATGLSMNGYQYRAVFTNSLGSDTTDTATLTVNASPATVTNLSAVISKGKITVSFTGAGDPPPTAFQCMMNIKRGSTWVSCVSGDVFKSSAKSVSVRAQNTTGWGAVSTVNVTHG